MDLKYIELENFRNFSNERIDLEESTIWILRGKNSSGKSTLACDALTYALFGKIKAMDEPADFRVKVDDIIKRGESNTEVRVDFAHKSDFYSVIRKRESSGSSSKETVTIYLNKRQIMDEEKKSIANRWIEKNLWTYNDFTNTTLILQDEMTKTLQMARAERKDYLERLFNIKNFEIMSERARERSKNLEADIRELDGAVKTDKDKVQDPLKLETKKVALKNILDSLTKQLGIAKKKKEEINKIKDDLRQIKIEEDNLVKEKKGLSDVINSLKTETSKLKKELDVIDKLLLTRAEIENKIKKIEKLEGELEKFTRLREELKELETDNKRWIKAIKKNKENLKKQLLQLENQINERKNLITDQEEEIKDLISKHDEIKNLEPKIDQLPKKKQELDQVKKTNQLYNDFLKQLSGKNSTLTAQISAKKKDMNKKRKTAENYESVKQELKIKKKNKLELEAKEAEKTGYLNDLEIINEKRSTVKSDIQVINTKISNHKSKISEYMNEIEEIKGLEGVSLCPRCKQKLTIEHVKTILQKINKNINKNENKIAGLKNNLEKTEKIREKLKNNKQEKTTILNDLDNIINRLRKSSDGIQSTEKELNKLNDIRVELDDFEKNGGIEALFQELRDEIKKLDEEANRHKIDPKYIESLEKEYIELNKLAITLKQYQRVVHKLPEKENRCKTSKIKLQENIIANNKLSETLENDQFAEEERKEVLIISGQIKEVNDKLEEEITLRKELTRLKAKEIRNIFKTIENEEKRRIEIKSKYEVKNERIRTENDRRAHITKTLQNEKFENFQEKQTENKKKSENAEETYDNTRTVKINASRDLDEHDRLIEDQLKLAKTISSREEKIKKIKETQDLLAELGKIFKQIGGRILSRLRNNINLETVEILELLANPQLQGITLENDYSLSIQTPEGDERPGFFSGGQRVRIGLAFRLALSQVLANFRGNELDTLIIDEGGFGALDEDGQKGVVDVFSAIQDRFQRMLIISHIDAIAENLPGTLIHIKDGSIVSK